MKPNDVSTPKHPYHFSSTTGDLNLPPVLPCGHARLLVVLVAQLDTPGQPRHPRHGDAELRQQGPSGGPGQSGSPVGALKVAEMVIFLDTFKKVENCDVCIY